MPNHSAGLLYSVNYHKREVVILLFILSFLPLDKGCQQVDIILVADVSASVSGREPFIVDAMHAFINRFTLSESDVKIGITTFNDRAHILSGLSADREHLHNTAERIIGCEGMTNITDGIYMAANELMENGRVGAYKMIILITDGGNNIGDAAYAADAVKTLNGIGICSILIKTLDSNRELMIEISSGCYEESGYETLLSVLQKIDVCL